MNCLRTEELKVLSDKQLIDICRCPEKRADVVMDTDTYNEIDDQFAIAYALRHTEKFRIRGFTCAPFRKSTRAATIAEGIALSCEETRTVLRLSGEERFSGMVYPGCTQFLPDEHTPVMSEAVEFLIRTSRAYTDAHRLYILATGAITNIASAILCDPSITGRICVVWLGGAAHGWWENYEYNMKQDLAAARVVISSDVPFVQIPAQGVTSDLIVSDIELRHYLKGKNAVCDFLYENSAKYMCARSPYKAWSKVIWDIVVPAWFLGGDGRFMDARTEYRRLPAYGSRTYEAPLSSRMVYVYEVHRDALINDMFEKLGGEKL